MPDIMDLPEWKGVLTGSRAARPQVPVATKDELLNFANALRAAGGAGLLTDLPISTPTDADACLIANSLNFSSEVDADGDHWHMKVVEPKFTKDEVVAITKVIGTGEPLIFSAHFEEFVPLHEWEADIGDPIDMQEISWILPEHIGNAADAFDRGVAFQSYVAADFHNE